MRNSFLAQRTRQGKDYFYCWSKKSISESEAIHQILVYKINCNVSIKFEGNLVDAFHNMRKEIKEPKLLSSGDVCKCLGVSYQYVEHLIDSGKLPFFQTSAGRIFRESDVLKFKEERRKRAKTDKRIQLQKR